MAIIINLYQRTLHKQHVHSYIHTYKYQLNRSFYRNVLENINACLYSSMLTHYHCCFCLIHLYIWWHVLHGYTRMSIYFFLSTNKVITMLSHYILLFKKKIMWMKKKNWLLSIPLYGQFLYCVSDTDSPIHAYYTTTTFIYYCKKIYFYILRTYSLAYIL